VQAILDKVAALLPSIEDEEAYSDVAAGLAYHQARLGKVEAALETVADLEQSEFELPLIQLAQGQAAGGDIEGAIGTADAMEQGEDRDFALLGLAMRGAEEGRLETALQIISLIEDPRTKASALSSSGMSQAHRGEFATADRLFEEAVSAALEVPNTFERVGVLLEVAERQAMDSNQTGATRTLSRAEALIEEVAGEPGSESLRALLVDAKAQIGMVDEAYRDQQAITEPLYRSWVLGAIAEAQARAGAESAALMTAEGIPETAGREERDQKALALSALVIEQSNAGDFDAALRTVEQMPERHWQRAHSLAGIGNAQAWRGEREEAVRTFRRAAEAAAAVEEAGMRAQAQRIVATSQAYAGFFEKAQRMAAAIETPAHERRNALHGVARNQALRGDAVGAVRSSGSLESPELRAMALLAVVGGLETRMASSR
jgi:tetratricopeptide (TPR) repeat protein